MGTGEAGQDRAELSGGEQSRAELRSGEQGRTGPSEAERSRADSNGGAQRPNVTTTDTTAGGVLGFDCIAATHQVLPWGSQYRNIVPREGHAWVLAALAADPQVAAAARAAEETVRSFGLSGKLLALLAYSAGSVIAGGMEGSAAAIVRIGDKDVSATVRLATADRALLSGCSEWAGLLVVLCILRCVRADVTLRLGNLQVVNGYGDGEHRFAHDWLRRNERGIAALAWEVAAE